MIRANRRHFQWYGIEYLKRAACAAWLARTSCMPSFGEEDVLSQGKQANLLEEQIRREQRSKLCTVVGRRDFDEIATNEP
jgi:hypothetical protein